MIHPENVCIIYNYFEKDEVYKKNFRHFLDFGISEQCFYYIVVVGEFSIDLPKLDNVCYIFSGNRNYDYGGHSLAVEHYIDPGCYDYFVFINCSVRGPFLPPYCTNESWFDTFLRLFDDNVGLVGSTINILSDDSPHSIFYNKKYGGTPPYAHVQTTIFALKKEAFIHLKNKAFFSCYKNLSREEVVSDYEINLSRLVLQGGWNIKCLLPEYNEFDYRGSDVFDINPTAVSGDAVFPASYFGRNIHPYEAVFIKTARSIWPESYLDSLTFSMSKRLSSGGSDYSPKEVSDMCEENIEFFGRSRMRKRILHRIRQLFHIR